MTTAPPVSPQELRQRAEEKVCGDDAAAQSLSPAETERLLHELRVHQIELEMQNEELHRTHQELAESKDRYYDLYDLAPVGYLTLSQAGIIQEANLTATALLGVTRKDLLRRRITDFILPEDQEVYFLHRRHRFEVFPRMDQTMSTQGCELRLQRPDNIAFWALLQDSLAYNDEIRITLTDITERKQAQMSLLEAKDDWESTFDCLTDMITIQDVNFNIIRANSSARLTLNLPLPATVTNSKCFTYFHGADQPPAGCPACTTLETGQSCSREFFEPHLNKYLEIRAIPRFDRDHRSIGFVHVVRDITERKQAEEEKIIVASQLQQAQKMEAVGRLAGGVAHDFNNMLGVIIGHAELALMKMEPSQPNYAALVEIKKAAERSANLTRQLLAFARKQTIAPKVLDLNETMAGMLKMLERLIGENIQLTWKPGENLWPIKADPSQLDQIFANLCVNAHDAITDIGVITLESLNCTLDKAWCATHMGSRPGDYVQIKVSDSGYGMSKEVLEHLFEPFFTTKEVGKGTGLGLAMVFGAVKQNKGFIDISSTPGAGTTFTIYLPRHIDNTEQLQAEVVAKPGSRGHETILLVEDEQAILEVTKIMLETQGYTVLSANTPGKAISMAREHAGEIQLLMTDVIMPEMNGRDLAKSLLSLYPHLKRLFMSGYTADIIAHHGVLEEGVHFIQKPMRMDELAAKVREALDWE